MEEAEIVYEDQDYEIGKFVPERWSTLGYIIQHRVAVGSQTVTRYMIQFKHVPM